MDPVDAVFEFPPQSIHAPGPIPSLNLPLAHLLHPAWSPVCPAVQTQEVTLEAASDDVVDKAVHVLHKSLPMDGLNLPTSQAVHPA